MVLNRTSNQQVQMKFLITICLLLVSMQSSASAQQRPRQQTSLTRSLIREAERRLNDMGYWTGPVDGVFDAGSQSALIAFQKWTGRNVTGKLNVDELTAIQHADAPTPRDSGYPHVEVDLDRQLLLIIGENGNVRILPVSSGSGESFIDDGQTSVAYTPRGRFVVYDKIDGWDHGPIGSLYYPNYISGGVAIHGSRNVPNHPASHGCIRFPMFAARAVSELTPLGTIVLVYDKVSFVSGRAWAENPKLKLSASIE